MRLRWCAAINNCFALRANKWGVCHHGEKVGTRVSTEIHNNHLGKFPENSVLLSHKIAKICSFGVNCFPEKNQILKIPDDSVMKRFKEKNDLQVSFNLNKDKGSVGEG